MARLLDTLPGEFSMWSSERYRLMMYKNYLPKAAGRREEALAVLERAVYYEHHPEPQFLATEWLSRRGETVRSRACLVWTRRAAARSLEDFSELEASRRLAEAMGRASAGGGGAG